MMPPFSLRRKQNKQIRKEKLAFPMKVRASSYVYVWEGGGRGLLWTRACFASNWGFFFSCRLLLRLGKSFAIRFREKSVNKGPTRQWQPSWNSDLRATVDDEDLSWGLFSFFFLLRIFVKTFPAVLGSFPGATHEWRDNLNELAWIEGCEFSRNVSRFWNL